MRNGRRKGSQKVHGLWTTTAAIIQSQVRQDRHDHGSHSNPYSKRSHRGNWESSGTESDCRFDQWGSQVYHRSGLPSVKARLGREHSGRGLSNKRAAPWLCDGVFRPAGSAPYRMVGQSLRGIWCQSNDEQKGSRN